jgi:hypothetical protein
LEMIEAVDPRDKTKLDEIDARVWVFSGQCPVKFNELTLSPAGYGYFHRRVVLNDYSPQYTESRDALKAIRPEGWYMSLEPRFICERFDGGMGFFAFAIKQTGGEVLQEATFVQRGGALLPTEELAELHAIIQAIAYERGEIL